MNISHFFSHLFEWGRVIHTLYLLVSQVPKPFCLNLKPGQAVVWIEFQIVPEICFQTKLC